MVKLWRCLPYISISYIYIKINWGDQKIKVTTMYCIYLWLVIAGHSMMNILDHC